jgi:hypothetical protein
MAMAMVMAEVAMAMAMTEVTMAIEHTIMAMAMEDIISVTATTTTALVARITQHTDGHTPAPTEG